mgnify:CR=1 FL=1
METQVRAERKENVRKYYKVKFLEYQPKQSNESLGTSSTKHTIN